MLSRLWRAIGCAGRWVVVGASILFGIVMLAGCSPTQADRGIAAPPMRVSVGVTSTARPTFTPKPTATAAKSLGFSVVVAKDENGLPMPDNKVSVDTKPRGWGDTYAPLGSYRHVMYLSNGQRVEILGRRGLDIRVKANGKTGWVRGWYIEKYRAECLRDYN